MNAVYVVHFFNRGIARKQSVLIDVRREAQTGEERNEARREAKAFIDKQTQMDWSCTGIEFVCESPNSVLMRI